ncbi:hypothetical protein J7E24_14355 [Hymenobacter sp. ISL-91]|uniref:hypothetical protein n=1 Tax=Hymenobacter sp. ISL-91 TaxID=2819151 RepID=UPI001BE53D91|nr:hypothetical protein [Hymenobacter sp. ISL-91]MBT2558973.1 hypothetical protein [Hymenobacter sp. ISL-91]
MGKIFHVIFSALLLFVVFACDAQSVAALDAKYGFRQYKFGLSSSMIAGLVKLKKDPYDNKYIVKYQKKDEDLMVGPYKLKNITYEFYKDKLMHIQLEADMVNSNGILELLQRLYGHPTQVLDGTKTKSDTNGREWFGKKVELSVVEWPGGDLSLISYACKGIYDEMFRDDKNEQMLLQRRKNTQNQQALKDL